MPNSSTWLEIAREILSHTESLPFDISSQQQILSSLEEAVKIVSMGNSTQHEQLECVLSKLPTVRRATSGKRQVRSKTDVDFNVQNEVIHAIEEARKQLEKRIQAGEDSGGQAPVQESSQ